MWRTYVYRTNKPGYQDLGHTANQLLGIHMERLYQQADDGRSPGFDINLCMDLLYQARSECSLRTFLSEIPSDFAACSR